MLIAGRYFINVFWNMHDFIICAILVLFENLVGTYAYNILRKNQIISFLEFSRFTVYTEDVNSRFFPKKPRASTYSSIYWQIRKYMRS